MLHYSVKMFTMTKEDELQLGADGYLQKLFQRKTHQDKFWNGFIFTSLFFSLVSKNSLLNLFTIYFFKKNPMLISLNFLHKNQFLSIYSIYLTRSVLQIKGQFQNNAIAKIANLEEKIEIDEKLEDNQLDSLHYLNKSIGQQCVYVLLSTYLAVQLQKIYMELKIICAQIAR